MGGMYVLEICDFILQYCLDNHLQVMQGKAFHILQEKGNSHTGILMAFNHLKKEGYLEEAAYGELYRLTASGKVFITNGGYKSLQEQTREAQEEEEREKELDKTLKQSTLQKNIFDRRVTYGTLFIAILSLIISYLSMRENNDASNDKIDNLAKKQMIMQREIDSLQNK